MAIKQLGLAFNQAFEKWMFAIIPCSLVLGYLLSDTLNPLVGAVPYLFAFVTLTMAIGCGVGQLKAVMRRPVVIVVTFAAAHIVAPVLAYWGGTALFGADSPYVVGLVLFALIPFGVSAVLWVGLSGGSVPLVLAMVVLDSLLSPFVVPAGIGLFFGASVEVSAGPLIGDLILIVVMPTVVGVALHQWSKGRIAERTKPVAAPLSKLCFASVVVLNAAAIAPHVDQLKRDMLLLVPVSIVLVALCYGLGMLAGGKFGDKSLQIAVSYATGVRNISLGIVLALGYFSPLAAVPVVLSILIQQPLATLHHYLLQKKFKGKPDKLSNTDRGQ